MSENTANDISSLYPSPPPYIRFFTEKNLAKLAEYKEQKETEKNDNDHDGEIEEEEVTNSELDFLIPPPMPRGHQYRAFGSVWQVKDQLPDLEVMGIKQLYKKSSSDEPTNYQYKISELKKLLKSLLLNYLGLAGVLSINPEGYEEKVNNIRTILVNIHHLLNEYRPHQSRESLIMLLEEQLEYKKNEIKKIEQVCQEVQKRLDKIQSNML
ncbi:hypothetical protein KAFR_0I02830 [Kazachstania africana CBS 2517]|uniref:Mediator of RNA polymerase II transcription subunit 7 n=1 Tax=Kazachstania africana (strain ATCC 22294 / BCRC 22015 / CBS 2517 / CECT 1963 / NBRC 1671 / NRRL Y-8276) TaxID=1071382 RepID=H2B0B2_KAZAF|nr:hypothetical protein KAFR_0I02830 [Kazachstania africana CBS 2517]CCF60062.1 hypothetical protein KAFR_0I02830 [Kazachstania africana CBS 2517]